MTIYLPPGFAERAFEHLYLTALTLLIALAIALPLGVLISRWRGLQGPVLGLLGILYTIPSLALLAFMVPFLGLGLDSALTALVLYSLVTLVRNTAAGFAGVDPAVIEAARGMGMTPGQIFRRIELPLALPVILAGMRITTLSVISLTTIAAWIGAGGLGQVLRDGILRNDERRILAAVAAVTLMAVLADVVYRGIEWLNTGYRRSPRVARQVEEVDEQEIKVG
jgi:osmoprotectant transport system permease protein